MHLTGDARAHVCTLHDSIEDVAPEDWESIVGSSGDLAMHRGLILAQERSLREQCRMWIAIVHDSVGLPCACACLCLFRVDAAVSAHPSLQVIVESARRLRPGLLRMGVLFCGLPVPAGECHLRLRPDADAARVMACLHEAMHALGREHGATLVVFKEFGGKYSELGRRLGEHAYIAGDVPPMHRLISDHRDFDSFLASMRSRYRSQVKRSLRKIETGGFAVERHVGADAIASAFTAKAHALYEHVWARSQHKLERLPHDFFIQAARAMDDDASLTIIRRRAGIGDVVGFTFSVRFGHVWHNLYSGVDYSINGDGDILFNLFYADLALAFDRGCSDIRLGQTSEAFKSRLGATPEPLRFFVRARTPIVHAGLRLLAPALFPSVTPPPTSRVFRESTISDPMVETRPASAATRRLTHVASTRGSAASKVAALHSGAA